VRYRQGRGEFEAKVVEVDTEKNLVTVERAKDGKKVSRPAAKLYPAA
jgi:ribosomal protein L16/L10AE